MKLSLLFSSFLVVFLVNSELSHRSQFDPYNPDPNKPGGQKCSAVITHIVLIIHTLRLFFSRVFSPHLSNVSIYCQFFDTYAYCTIAEFVLQYSHKDKSRRQLALTTASSKTNGLLSALACMDIISLYPRFVNFRWRKDTEYGFFRCNRPRSLAARGRTMRMRSEQLWTRPLEMQQASQLELPW